MKKTTSSPNSPDDPMRFRAIFEQSEVPTQLYSAEGRILSCNSAWYRWTRLAPADLDKVNAGGYCLLEDPVLIRTGVAENFRKALTGVAVQTPPIFYTNSDYGLPAQAAWIQANFYPIPDSRGEIVEVLILHHDVSELMEAKKAAEQALEQAKRIAEKAPFAIQIYDASGHSIFTNEQHTRIFGGPPPPGYCCLTDSLLEEAGLLHLVKKAFSGEPTQVPVLWYNPADLKNLNEADSAYTKKFGTKCAIETHLLPICDQGGNVSSVVFIFKDVTGELFVKQERESALKERDDARVLIQSVLDQARAVIYIKDLEGKHLFVNDRFCQVFAKTRGDTLGKSNYELFSPDIAGDFHRNDLRVLSTKSHVELEEEAIHADGSKHSYLSLKFPLVDSQGKLHAMCGISTDITQYRLLERQLSTAKRMEAVGILAGGVAHNFNNLIGVILLIADTLLLRGQAKTPELKSALEDIKSTAQSAARVTRQLLTFGREQPSEPRIIDLGVMIEAASGILVNALGEDVRLRVDVATGCWPVHIDPIAAEQILTNLVFNAKDAMPRGGTLKVALRNVSMDGSRKDWRIGSPRGEYVELAVSDSGAGIGHEHLDRIFEPFFSTKKDGQGTGLGLSTVYGSVQAAGGDIAVESAPGRGATFRVCLPRAEGPVTAVRQSAVVENRDVRGTETILLIEDQPTLRKITATLLRERGYTVLEARDGTSALALWEEESERVDLVVSDIVIPGNTGIALIQAMTRGEKRRPIQALFVSAHSEKKLSGYGFDRGSYHFIQKPYTADELLAKIRDVLDV